MRKILFLLTLLLSVPFVANAQQEAQTEQRLVSVPRSFFVPHWYVKAQGGAAYDVGEAKFSQLLSPGLQLAMGYKFNEKTYVI